MSEITTSLHKANSRSVSLRTTVPRSIASLLHLEEGDKLHWDIGFFPTEINFSNMQGVSSPPLLGIVVFVKGEKK